MKLVIDDGVQLQKENPPLFVKDAIKLLSALPDGRLLTMAALADKTGRQTDCARNHSTHPALAPYKAMRAHSAYFGNKRTIKEALKLFK